MSASRIEHRWIRKLQPVGGLALAIGLTAGAAAPAVAQGTPPAGGQAVDLTGAQVALHDGSCANPVLAPEFEIGALEAREFTQVAGDLRDDVGEAGLGGEDLDGDGILDAGEDLDGDGVLDGGEEIAAEGPLDEGAAGDRDGDGIADVDEEGYLTEDLDGDGVLDDGEDLDEDGILDAGIDADADGVLAEDEVFADASAPDLDTDVILIDYPTVWRADEEVEATFEELFGVGEDGAEESEDDDALDNPGLVAVHDPANYDTILACADLSVPGWEDRDDVVVGLGSTGGAPISGYAVFERDTGNFPIFGENTTGVTVYLFGNLGTMRSERMMTPEAGQAAETPAAFDLPTEATIEVGNLEFNPSEFRVAAGTDVAVTLSNLSTSPSNFSIDELGIDEDLEPGETRTITVNAPAGTYEYYSAAGDDRAAGMVGTLIVGQ